MCTTPFCNRRLSTELLHSYLSLYGLKKWLHLQPHPSSCISFSNNDCKMCQHPTNTVPDSVTDVLSRSRCQWSSWHFSSWIFSLLSVCIVHDRRDIVISLLGCISCFEKPKTKTGASVMGGLYQSFMSSSRLYLFMFYFLSFVNIWGVATAYYIRVCRPRVYILFLMKKNKHFNWH